MSGAAAAASAVAGPDLATALAVAVARLEDAAEDIRDLRAELRAANEAKVSRREWELRNENVDQRFTAQGRELAQLRADAAGRRAPWWTVVAVALSGGALAWSILGPAVTAS